MNATFLFFVANSLCWISPSTSSSLSPQVRAVPYWIDDVSLAQSIRQSGTIIGYFDLWINIDFVPNLILIHCLTLQPRILASLLILLPPYTSFLPSFLSSFHQCPAHTTIICFIFYLYPLPFSTISYLISILLSFRRWGSAHQERRERSLLPTPAPWRWREHEDFEGAQDYHCLCGWRAATCRTPRQGRWIRVRWGSLLCAMSIYFYLHYILSLVYLILHNCWGINKIWIPHVLCPGYSFTP